MAYTVDWPNGIINIPKSDLTLIQSSPTEIYELNLNTFHLTLRDLQEDENEGRPWPTTHQHNTEVTISGIQYARQVLLSDYYSVTFEDGQYAVNFIGANTNLQDKVNVNQVSVRPNNSGGLISTRDVQFATYDGKVVVDVDNLSTRSAIGSAHPRGTFKAPTNNLTDVGIILNREGLPEVYAIGDLTIGNEYTWDRYRFRGEGTNLSTLTIQSAASVSSCQFWDSTLTGTLDGGSTVFNCDLGTLNFVDGKIYNSGLTSNTITLGANVLAEFWDCKSKVPGTGTPVIDCNETGRLSVRNYNGGIKVINYTGSGNHSFDMNSGQVILDSATVTGGTFVVRGKSSKLIDENGNVIPTGTWNGGVTIVNETSPWDLPVLEYSSVAGSFGEAIRYLRQAKVGRTRVNPNNSTLEIYEEDDTTLLLVLDLKDALGADVSWSGNELLTPFDRTPQ